LRNTGEDTTQEARIRDPMMLYKLIQILPPLRKPLLAYDGRTPPHPDIFKTKAMKDIIQCSN
jgi:hypothetical protein